MEEEDDPTTVAAAEAPIARHHEPQAVAFSPLPLLPDIVDFRDHEEDDVDEEEEDEEVEVDAPTHHPANTSPAGDPNPGHGSSFDGSGAGDAAAEVNHSVNGVVAGAGNEVRRPQIPYIDPEPHISSQFYTFNKESHALMARCILERRVATPDEIRKATSPPVLKSWRLVWKDRNEDTAYITAWKRIQEKLNAHVDSMNGNRMLYFKNNASQYVSHTEQWQEIVTSFHGDADLRHLGLKETIERIKQVWTVGAKFYGIPESFIRVCVGSCPVCNGDGQTNGGGHGGSSRTKRRRFEYTESFDVPAKDVPNKLQQLAAKHKVVLCIRQKYIRYKPFMAEVKDYACHRAGEPSSTAASKKSKVLKREPYASKRCGCGFRIRAIVPIANYNEKDKTFVYQEEGTAVFKLYAMHTGHEPGPSDGSARIIHRVVGHKGFFDQDTVAYGVNDDMDSQSYASLPGKEDVDDVQFSVLQQVQELRNEIGLLEGKVIKVPQELLGVLSQELSHILNRFRSMRENCFSEKPHNMGEEVVVEDGALVQWEQRIPGGNNIIYDKDIELIEEETDFDHTLGDGVPWDSMRMDCRSRDMLMAESSNADKWALKDCNGFDEHSILDCGEEEDLKIIKPLRHGGLIGSDHTLVGMHMDGFYSDSAKWYDSPSGMDPSEDTGTGDIRRGIL